MNNHRSDPSSLPNPSECSRALDDLGAFLDGELTPEACVRFKDHLAACDYCRRHEAALRDDWQLLEKLPASAAYDPEAFVVGVRRRIGRDRRRRFLRVAVAAVAAAVLGFVLWSRDADRVEDEAIIQSLAVVEDLHGEIDPQILNLLAMSPDLFLPPLTDEDGGDYLVDDIAEDGTEDSIDDIIDFLLDESEEYKL
jgi:hypothetical protein